MTNKQEYFLLPHTRLELHPRNMRRYYPPSDVKEMAQSIKASKGVIQALTITPHPKRIGHYYVIDGNMRLAGARHLGNDCPLLKCDLVDYSEAEQLLAMITTSKVHFPKDIISEALHYQRLIEEGFTRRQIAEGAGVSYDMVTKALTWLEIDPEIQELAAQKKLPKSRSVVVALKSITNKEIRIKMARKFAENRFSTRQIQLACERTVQRLSTEKDQAERMKAEPPPTPQPSATPPKILQIKRPKKVELHSGNSGYTMPIEGAKIVMELAEELCNECSVKGPRQECNCGGMVEFSRRLWELSQEALTHEALVIVA